MNVKIKRINNGIWLLTERSRSRYHPAGQAMDVLLFDAVPSLGYAVWKKIVQLGPLLWNKDEAEERACCKSLDILIMV